MDFQTSSRTPATTRFQKIVNVFSATILTIQQSRSSESWPRLASRQPLPDIERDITDSFTIPRSTTPTSNASSETAKSSHTAPSPPPPELNLTWNPQDESPNNSLTSEYTFTDLTSPATISPFTLTPASWTPQTASTRLSQSPAPVFFLNDDDDDMAELPTPFTGKPEDQDPQDFFNRLELVILLKTALTPADKVRYFELLLKVKSPAAEWYETLTDTDTATIASIRRAFNIRWPPKPITKRTTAEKQSLLNSTILKPSDLGRRVAASAGGEEELTHIVWADRVERLAKDIPDSNNLLVAATRDKLPKALLKLVGMKPMTWEEFANAVRAITVEELMAKVEEERDLARVLHPTVPDTPSKALGAAFQNINLTPQTPRALFGGSYQQRPQQPDSRTSYVDRPARERMADVLTKALPIHANNAEGFVSYQLQVTNWQTANGLGLGARGPSESRPYPLSPGTVPVASGECWTCGQRSHHPASCSSPPVPPLESKWRSIAQTIRKRAEAAVTETPVANVNLVSTTSDDIQTYDPDVLTHLLQLAGQGNVDGSSM